MLKWDRTSFGSMFTQVKHVAANGAAYYDDLVLKYGGDNVFRASSAAAQNAINDAISACRADGNGAVVLYPGTYTLGATISVAKNVTITGCSENADEVIIDCGTSAVTAFTVGAAGDYAKIKNLTISGTTSTADYIIIPSTAPGVKIENVIFDSDDSTSVVGVDAEPANVEVRRCKFKGPKFAAQFLGDNCLFVGNYVQSAVNSAIAVEFEGGSDYSVSDSNLFDLTGTTTNAHKVGYSTTTVGVLLANNRYGINTSVHALVSTTGTVSYLANVKAVIATTIATAATFITT